MKLQLHSSIWRLRTSRNCYCYFIQKWQTICIRFHKAFFSPSHKQITLIIAFVLRLGIAKRTGTGIPTSGVRQLSRSPYAAGSTGCQTEPFLAELAMDSAALLHCRTVSMTVLGPIASLVALTRQRGRPMTTKAIIVLTTD